MDTQQVGISESSTTYLSRKGLDVYAVVRFDSECSLCRSLADFMGQRVGPDLMTFAPSSQAQHLEIEIKIGEEVAVLSGSEAWAWLLQQHPSLKEINWLAQKLGIHSATSNLMMRSTDFLRKFCFRCR